MSKKKQLIHDVFERIKKISEKDTKSGWADDLADDIENKIKFKISGKTLSRYYDSYITEVKEETTIETLILNRLSQYLGFNDYEHFSTTIEKEGDEASRTTVQVDVDNNSLFSTNDGSGGVTINITNTNTNSNDNDQTFKVPDFIKQNGLGILEISFLLCLVTGNVLFSGTKKENSTYSQSLGFMSFMKPIVEKKYMYWDGEQYIGTDSIYISPGINIVAMNSHKLKHFRRIMRKDTLTDVNALGKVWYSKYNNEVEFFTDDGVDPDNGRELRKVTSLIIYKYAGKQKDSIVTEE